jgi:hypothetical protein
VCVTTGAPLTATSRRPTPAPRTHADGYLPFNVSWYRKHFTVDASMAGQNIWLDFDGVYRNR